MQSTGTIGMTGNKWQVWDGLLPCHFVRHDDTGDYLQFLLPEHCVPVVFHVHDFLLGGHLGQKKTREKALQHFYESDIHEECNSWLTQCDACT